VTHDAGTAGRDGGVLGDVQRHGRGGRIAASDPRIRVAGLVLLIAYLAIAGWLALRPVSVPWVAPANLHPFATIRPDLDEGSRTALTGLAGRMAMLAPLGFLLPLATGGLERSLPATWARTVGGGALISSAIMLLQSGVPGHVVNVDSVLLNTTGVALAFLLVFVPLRAFLHHGNEPSPRTGVADGAGGTGGPGRAGGAEPGAGPGGLGSHDALHRREDAGQGRAPRAAGVGIAP
jgi:glycopeptide antibiotics resistance protein